MKKKLVTTVALAVGLTSVLAACGKEPAPDASSNPGATTAPKEFTVSFRHTQIKDTAKKRKAMFEDVLKEVEGKVPGLKFEPEGVDEVVNRDTKLKAEMAAGNPPKIFELFGGADTKNYAKTNNLLDLTPILKELNLTDSFVDLSEFTVDGKVYGLPTAGYVQGVFYNKKIFKDNGVEVPKTYAEFLKVAETLKGKGVTPLALGGNEAWALNMLPNTLYVRNGGQEVVAGLVSGTTKWTDEAFVKGHKQFKEDMWDKGFFNQDAPALKYAQMQDLFAGGKTAMIFDGGWANQKYSNPDQSKIVADLGFFNFPTVEGGKGNELINGSYSNGFGFSAKLNENEKKAVTEFIKVMYSEKYQVRQLTEEGFFPSMKLKTGDVKPIINEMLKAAEGKKTFPAFDAIVQPKVKLDLENGIQALVGGKKKVEEILADVQKSQEAENKKAAK
ncbi:ABC transporter substrate-binding protein [Paenibacillus lutrae]|uniref:Extracellular solute-binding protein n=1 Tax=Paenibacillus lutrae TaxID=2078573 RepID=A0A7X3FHA8_9BACL|nr:extracellular solute-binding protein [Paenibacillus lutrae]MVO99597.1 extracellular solute-binding protein [Paenibacillus lutrae]